MKRSRGRHRTAPEIRNATSAYLQNVMGRYAFLAEDQEVKDMKNVTDNFSTRVTYARIEYKGVSYTPGKWETHVKSVVSGKLQAEREKRKKQQAERKIAAAQDGIGPPPLERDPADVKGSSSGDVKVKIERDPPPIERPPPPLTSIKVEPVPEVAPPLRRDQDEKRIVAVDGSGGGEGDEKALDAVDSTAQVLGDMGFLGNFFSSGNYVIPPSVVSANKEIPELPHRSWILYPPLSVNKDDAKGRMVEMFEQDLKESDAKSAAGYDKVHQKFVVEGKVVDLESQRQRNNEVHAVYMWASFRRHYNIATSWIQRIVNDVIDEAHAEALHVYRQMAAGGMAAVRIGLDANRYIATGLYQVLVNDLNALAVAIINAIYPPQVDGGHPANHQNNDDQSNVVTVANQDGKEELLESKRRFVADFNAPSMYPNVQDLMRELKSIPELKHNLNRAVDTKLDMKHVGPGGPTPVVSMDEKEPPIEKKQEAERGPGVGFIPDEKLKEMKNGISTDGLIPFLERLISFVGHGDDANAGALQHAIKKDAANVAVVSERTRFQEVKDASNPKHAVASASADFIGLTNKGFGVEKNVPVVGDVYGRRGALLTQKQREEQEKLRIGEMKVADMHAYNDQFNGLPHSLRRMYMIHDVGVRSGFEDPFVNPLSQFTLQTRDHVMQYPVYSTNTFRRMLAVEKLKEVARAEALVQEQAALMVKRQRDWDHPSGLKREPKRHARFLLRPSYDTYPAGDLRYGSEHYVNPYSNVGALTGRPPRAIHPDRDPQVHNYLRYVDDVHGTMQKFVSSTNDFDPPS